jgi:hypothetical protein
MHRATKLGIGVARPLDDERYDLILDFCLGLVRVQSSGQRSHYEFGARLWFDGPIAQLGERLDGIQKAAGSSPAGSIGH